MLVREQMERELLTATPTDRCDRALMLMRAAGVTSLPVVEGDRLVGMVSEVDIRRAAPALVRSPGGHVDVEAVLPYVRVGGVMTIAPPTVRPETPLADAVSRMSRDGVAFLPVVDDQDRLVGVLSFRSLFGLLAASLRDPTAAGNGRHATATR